jgi:hypothetical protein
MNKLLTIFIALLIAIPAVLATDLSTYPSFFNNVNIVIADGNTTDVQSAFQIGNALQTAGIHYQIRMASEITSPAGLQIISVGTNPVTTAIDAANTHANYTLQRGQSRIALYENAGVVQMVVEGNTIADTAKGAYVLAHTQSFPLQYTDTIVTGVSPSFNLSRIMPSVDYSCGGNQSFGDDGSWPQPCLGAVLVQYFPIQGQTGGSGNGGNGADTTAPALTVPASFSVQGTVPTVVTYTATATDNVDGAITPVCAPVSGSTFALGATTVNCHATDAAGNIGTASFVVTVQTTPPPIVIVPGAALTFSDVTLGNDNTDRGQTVTTTATLTNIGTVTLSGFTFSGIDSKYNITLTGLPATLASGQSAPVTVSGFVPYDLSAVDSSCNQAAQSIGTMTVHSTEGASASPAVRMQAINELFIDKITAIINGETKDIWGKSTDLMRGQPIEVHVKYKNKFSTSSDEGQDQQITVSTDVKGDTDELDLNEKDSVDVPSHGSDEAVLTATVDDNARGSIRMTITGNGRDEKNAKHCDDTILRFNVPTDELFHGTTQTQNTDTQPTFVPFIDTQPAKPAVAPQEPPRQEDVTVIQPVTPVQNSGFRDSKVYSSLLIGMIVLMLAVIAAEAAFIFNKRRQKLEPQIYK